MAEEKKYPISLKEVEAEYQELSARMNYDGSKYLPRILKRAFTLEQARVALELYASTGEIADTLGISKEEVESEAQKYQVEAIAKKLGIDKETIEKHIRYMFELGFGFPTRRGWKFARTMMQAKDSQTNPKYDEQLGDEYFDLWEAFQKIEAYPTWYPQQFPLADRFGAWWRIIPARKSLKNIPYEDIVPEDNIEEIFKAKATIAVEHCPCKRLVRDRACHSPTEVCFIMDELAEHNLRRGAARVVDVKEALAIHDMAAEHGMICMPQGNITKRTLNMLCHCHWCCCDDMLPAIMQNYPLHNMLAASSYRPVVDPDICTGCQACVAVCQFGAIEIKRYPGQYDRQDRLKAWVDPDKCLGCGLCVIKCPAEARTMRQVKTVESLPEERPHGSTYTGVPNPKEGKHLDTGSVVTRPLY